MSQKRIDKLISFRKRNDKNFSSIKDFERLHNELIDIKSSENSPPTTDEVGMFLHANFSLLARFHSYVFRTELENVFLSDEELEQFEKSERLLPKIYEEYEKIIVYAENTLKSTFSKFLEEGLVDARGIFSLKSRTEAEETMVKIIQREKARRQNIPNNSNLGDEIVKVSKQIKNTETKDLERVRRLLSELKKKLTSGEKNKNDSELFTATFALVIDKCKEFFDKWKKNEIDPSDKELDNAKKVVKEVLDDVARLGPEDLPNNFPKNYLSEAKRELEAFEEKLKEKIPYRRDGQDSSEREINDLKSQIKVLENKINNTSDTDPNKQQYRREIEQLKARLEEKENKQSQPSKGDNFPWKKVFGIGGAIVIILVVIFLIKKIAKS